MNTLNDLAWLLATDPGPSPRDPARALALAEEAVRISSDHDASWNTLGVARYRAGDWAGAIEALERSALSSPRRRDRLRPLFSGDGLVPAPSRGPGRGMARTGDGLEPPGTGRVIPSPGAVPPGSRVARARQAR